MYGLEHLGEVLVSASFEGKIQAQGPAAFFFESDVEVEAFQQVFLPGEFKRRRIFVNHTHKNRHTYS